MTDFGIGRRELTLADKFRGIQWGLLLLLGLIVTVTALPCDMLVALAGAKLARLFAAQARRRWPSRLAGSTLIGLGLYTALMRRS